MTTSNFSTRVRHDSDALFREWAQEVHDKLIAIGLQQTADTGQANLATMTRPAAGALTLYEIFTFNDSLQATAPIFLKVCYSTSSGGASAPAWFIGIGTGSDGAGNLTVSGMGGTSPATPLSVAIQQGGFSNVDTVRQSDFCHTEGFLGIAWKNAAVIGLPGFFFLSRTIDEDGVPDGRGAIACWDKAAGGNPTRQSIRFAAPATGHPQNITAPSYNLGFMPQAPSSSTVGSDHQIAPAWTFCDGAEPIHGLCGVYPAQQADNSTFSIALVGATSHTYKVLANTVFGHPTSMHIAMLWE